MPRGIDRGTRTPEGVRDVGKLFRAIAAHYTLDRHACGDAAHHRSNVKIVTSMEDRRRECQQEDKANHH